MNEEYNFNNDGCDFSETWNISQMRYVNNMSKIFSDTIFIQKRRHNEE
jgi:hypothetical protein